MFLDTHAVVFLHAGKLTEFSQLGRQLLETEPLIVSPMCVLELQYLYEIQHIRYNSHNIIQDLSSDIGLQQSGHRAMEAAHIAAGYGWTRDPFDRMISAYAQAAAERLLTRDTTIRNNCSFAVW
ncbi:type II toxin-antitoxin system VapC family toxin [Spirochaeta dissipatitropha]